MGRIANYRSAKYHHIGADELYVDHGAVKSLKEDAPHRFSNTMQSLVARIKATFKKDIRIDHHTKVIRQQLRDAGLNGMDLMKPETYAIGSMLHDNESVIGAIVGIIEDKSSALLVVTTERIIFLNQIPLFTKMEEIYFDIVTGVSESEGGLDAGVTLHTGIGDFSFRRVTISAARNFVLAIEQVAMKTARS